MSWLTERLGIHNGKIQVSAGPSRRVKEETETGARQAMERAKAEALRLGLKDEDVLAIGNAAYHQYRNAQKSWIEKSAQRDFAAGGKITGGVMGTVGGVVAVFPGIGTVIGAVTIAAGAAVSAAGVYAEALERDKQKMEAAKVQFDKLKKEMMLNPALSDNSGIGNAYAYGKTDFDKAQKELEKLRKQQLEIMLCIERENTINDRQKQELESIQKQIDKIQEGLKINWPDAKVTGVSSNGAPVSSNPEPVRITNENPLNSTQYNPNNGNAINANPKPTPPGIFNRFMAWIGNFLKSENKQKLTNDWGK